ncbi:tape measure protein [Aeromonas veronii]|uniref:tape measure protein n=1 Tax=Aeromonas veronii TaxID=654 RepID=UPI003F78C391
MSTNTTLKLALELAAKATGREDLAALASEVQELGPISDETAAETERLAQTLEGLTQQRDLIAQFEASERALGQLEQASTLSRDRLAQLRREQQETGSAARQLTDQERMLASEVKQLERQLIAQSASHNRLQSALGQAGFDTRNLAQEQQRLQRELTQTVTHTERLANELGETSRQANTATTSLSGVVGSLAAMVGTYLGVQALSNQLMAMFQSGDQAERLSVQLKAVMGSIEGGKEASAWIQDFAKNTPLQLDQVTQVFVRLKAFGIDPMNGSMQGIVDQAFKLGGGFEEVQGISLALGQAWAKQKLQGEEILQLMERGVPVWDMLEKVTGKNTAELQKLSEAGLLGRDTIQALMNEIAAQSSGAAAANMGLLSGLISNAQDNLETFYRMVASSGALDWLKNQLANLNAEVEAMTKDGRLKLYAQQISDWLVQTGESTKQFLLNIGSSWDGLIQGTVAAVQSLRVVMNLFTGSVKGLAAVLLSPLQAIGLLLNGIAQLADAVGMNGLAAQIRYGTGLINAQFRAMADAAYQDFADVVDAANIMANNQQSVTATMQAEMSKVAAASEQSAAAVVGSQAKVQQAQDATTENNAKLAEAFKTLGLDFEQANGRIGEGFQKTIGALDVLVAHTGASSAAIEEALATAYNSAKTTAEIDAVIERQKQLATQGKITGDALARSMAISGAAMAKVKGGSGDTKQAVAAIGDGFTKAAKDASSATATMKAGLADVKAQADATGAAVASAGGSSSALSSTGRGDVTRTVGAGSFYYKTVDLNGLRGNAEGLANTLAGVEDELARYSQKVKDIPAYSEWSKYYGEKFQKEMEVMRARLKEELDKAQAKELEKSATPAAPVPVSTLPQVQTPSAPVTRQLQPIVIQLGERSARIDVAQEQVTGLLDVLRRYQEGQT